MNCRTRHIGFCAVYYKTNNLRRIVIATFFLYTKWYLYVFGRYSIMFLNMDWTGRKRSIFTTSTPLIDWSYTNYFRKQRNLDFCKSAPKYQACKKRTCMLLWLPHSKMANICNSIEHSINNDTSLIMYLLNSFFSWLLQISTTVWFPAKKIKTREEFVRILRY